MMIFREEPFTNLHAGRNAIDTSVCLWLMCESGLEERRE